MAVFAVIYDACVLHPPSLRDLLIRLALTGKVRARWTDEIDLAPGRFRMKAGGGAAGQNGVRSLISQLGPDFRRGRMGVGHPGDPQLVHSHVLSDFHKADQPWLEALLTAVAEALPFALAGDDDTAQRIGSLAS